MFLRLGLPFADSPKAKCNAEQLLRGVFACANSYEADIEGQLQGEWALRFEQWVKRVRKQKPDMVEALAVFRAHLADGYRMAPVWRHVAVPGSVSMSAPWEELLKCRLVQAGFTLSEVLNGYLPEKWYDYFTLGELDQLKTCEDASKWRKTFYTIADALEDEATEAIERTQTPLGAPDAPEQGNPSPQAETPPKTAP